MPPRPCDSPEIRELGRVCAAQAQASPGACAPIPSPTLTGKLTFPSSHTQHTYHTLPVKQWLPALQLGLEARAEMSLLSYFPPSRE